MGARRDDRRRRARAGGLAVLLLAVGACSGDDDTGTGSDPDRSDGDGAAPVELPYAASGWPAVHADAGNRKHVPTGLADSYESAWHVLQDAAVLTAPTVGPDGSVYVPTGLGPGHANLHAYSSDGELLWATEPWQDAYGFDSCAIIESPVVDAAGDLYVSDCDQLWAFHPDGEVKWTVDLPAPGPGAPWQDDRTTPFRPFVGGAGFTADGSLFGITVWNQMVVVDRETGELRAPVTQLPATEAPPADSSMTQPPTMFSGGFADPELNDPVWQLFWGGVMPQANTPSTAASTGRIFAVSSTTEGGGRGVLYGIDYTPGGDGAQGEITVAFEAVVGPGSSSSPTVSHDDATVYVSDQDGVLYAVDATGGEVLCNNPEAGTNGGSLTAGPDGRVYALGDQGLGVSAYDDGCEKAWEADLGEITAGLPADTPLGPPTWKVGGLPTITDDGLLAPASVGYDVPLAGQKPFVAVGYHLVVIDPATGRLDRVLAPESAESDGLTVATTVNDVILAGYGIVAQSSLAPLAAMVDAALPADHPMLPPVGGVEAFVPAAAARQGELGQERSP